MPRNLIKSDASLKAIKPGDHRQRISDGDGLFLLLFVKGGSHGWRFTYSHEGRRKMLSMGTYPDTGLALARQKADEARELVARGFDPSDKRKQRKAEVRHAQAIEKLVAEGKPMPDSFEAVAREWHETHKDEWVPEYATSIMNRLGNDAFPIIGTRPIGQITPPELLQVLRLIEKRGALDSARRMKIICGQVFDHAVGKGLATVNAARNLQGQLRSHVVRHFPAILNPERLGEMLRACAGYSGTYVVRAALQLAPMLMVRPTELRCARWSEFDLDTATWLIPAARMKRKKEGKLNGQPHFVPLPRQAVEVLRELKRLTGSTDLVFPSIRNRKQSISNNTVNAALRAMGFTGDEVVQHGFRATARTMLEEGLGFEEKHTELQLAHTVRGPLRRAYNRTEFMDDRRAMMQVWADHLDKLRDTIAQPKTPATGESAPAAITQHEPEPVPA